MEEAPFPNDGIDNLRNYHIWVEENSFAIRQPQIMLNVKITVVVPI